MANVHHTILQASPTTFYMLIWIEAQGFDPRSGRLDVPPQAIALTLPSATKTVTNYSYDNQWNLNPEVLSQHSSTSSTTTYGLDVTDSISILRIDL